MKFPTPLVLAGCLASTFVSCDENPQAGGTSDDTHSDIRVSGRVFDERSKPLGAVIVRLRDAGLSDTTDGDGRYSIEGNLVAARSFSGLDTADFLRDGAVVHSEGIDSWVVSLPDLFLVQRDISGSILPGALGIASVRVALWNSRGDSIPVEVEWSPASGRYSGFSWFRYTGGLDTFQVQASARDSLGRSIGISQKLTFTSRAGDIQIPTFAADNLVPRVSLTAPERFVRGDTARVRGIVEDASGQALRYEWKIGSGGWTVGGTDTLLRVPASESGRTLAVGFRAMRDDGISDEETLVRPVEGNGPRVSVAVESDSVRTFHRFRVDLRDTVGSGTRIVRRRIGAPWNVDVSGRDTVLTAPDDVGSFTLRYVVLDARGDSAVDSVRLVATIALPPGLRAWADSEAIHVAWDRHPGSEKNLMVAILMSDSTLGIEGATYTVGGNRETVENVPFDSLGLTISRQSAARRTRLTFQTFHSAYLDGQFRDMSAETTLVVENPSLVWTFEHPFHFSDDEVYGSIIPLYAPDAYPAGGSEEMVPDAVFGSSVAEVEYQNATGNLGQLWLYATGWRDVSTLSFRCRGSAASAWLWLEPRLVDQGILPSYDSLRSRGITLGWNMDVDPAGGVVRLSTDSLRWSDGVARANPSIREVLARAWMARFKFSRTSGTVILDDIRFENR